MVNSSFQLIEHLLNLLMILTFLVLEIILKKVNLSRIYLNYNFTLVYEIHYKIYFFCFNYFYNLCSLCFCFSFKN